jgi:hypothetical protein
VNAHPTNRAERLKLKSTKDRRKKILNEAIKRQEAEDELEKARDLDLLRNATAGGGDIPEDFAVEMHKL